MAPQREEGFAFQCRTGIRNNAGRDFGHSHAGFGNMNGACARRITHAASRTHQIPARRSPNEVRSQDIVGRNWKTRADSIILKNLMTATTPHNRRARLATWSGAGQHRDQSNRTYPLGEGTPHMTSIFQGLISALATLARRRSRPPAHRSGRADKLRPPTHLTATPSEPAQLIPSNAVRLAQSRAP